MDNVVCHFKVYRFKLSTDVVPMDGKELSHGTINYIKSKQFIHQIEEILKSGCAFDLNLAYIKVKKANHTYDDKLTVNMIIGVSQKLSKDDLLRHFRWAFSVYSKSGACNGYLSHRDEIFYFNKEKIILKYTKKLMGVRISLDSRIIF